MDDDYYYVFKHTKGYFSINKLNSLLLFSTSRVHVTFESSIFTSSKIKWFLYEMFSKAIYIYIYIAGGPLGS